MAPAGPSSGDDGDGGDGHGGDGDGHGGDGDGRAGGDGGDGHGSSDPAEPIEVTLDEGALYVVVRRAVEDAVLGVIGTLLLVGVALVLVWVGGMIALSSAARQPVPAVVGVAIALAGLYLAAATLEVIPPVREWF